MSGVSGNFFRTVYGALEKTHSIFVCVKRVRLYAGPLRYSSALSQIAPLSGMIGEPLGLLAQPVRVELFRGIDNAYVDIAATFMEHPTIGDIVSEGVLEGVLQIGKSCVA